MLLQSIGRGWNTNPWVQCHDVSSLWKYFFFFFFSLVKTNQHSSVCHKCEQINRILLLSGSTVSRSGIRACSCSVSKMTGFSNQKYSQPLFSHGTVMWFIIENAKNALYPISNRNRKKTGNINPHQEMLTLMYVSGMALQWCRWSLDDPS